MAMTGTDPPREVRVFSFGGGMQSTAALVLSATGRLEYRTFLFANVGDDSEDPATLDYVRDHAIPFAAANGLDLRVLHRHRRDGTPETLFGRLTKDGSRSLPIPVRMDNGAPGTRSCTADFKIRVIGKYLRDNKLASADRPATVGIGISVDEIHRANTRRVEPYERIDYPLLRLGLRRTDCTRVITDAGLPVPPKSACWFCPFHRASTWQAMREDRPDLFERAAKLEDLLNARRDRLGKDRVYLTRYARPLRQAIPAGVSSLPFADDGDGSCDSGWCFT